MATRVLTQPSVWPDPFVEGTADLEETLTLIGGEAYDLQWLRDGATIAGATGASYTVTTLDAGRALTCRYSRSTTPLTVPGTPVDPGGGGDPDPGDPGDDALTMLLKRKQNLTLTHLSASLFGTGLFPSLTTSTVLHGNVVDYRTRTGPTNPSTGQPANFGWYLSTDHDGGTGGIWLAVADAITGPWVAYNGGSRIYYDGSASQTETPVVVYHESTQQWFMYYQTNSGGIGSQSTRMAVSPNGATAWESQGIVLDVPVTRANFPGDGHTGYMRPMQFAETDWAAVSLMGGNTYSKLALWNSRDGVQWIPDPRPLQLDLIDAGGDPARKLTFLQYFLLDGQKWALAHNTNVGAGANAATKITYAVAGPVTPDLRKFDGPPVVLLEPTAAWEQWNFSYIDVVAVDSTPYLIYGTATDAGVAAITVA